MNLFKLWNIAEIILAAIIMSAVIPPDLKAGADFPSILPEAVITKYGKPDIIDSTEYDKPRPLFVTKWLTYQKEKVKFMFIADAPMGSSPPYEKWKLVGAMDPRNDAMLEPKEVKRRMSRRQLK